MVIRNKTFQDTASNVTQFIDRLSKRSVVTSEIVVKQRAVSKSQGQLYELSPFLAFSAASINTLRSLL